MKPTDRQKMCVNCDGRVPFESIACPYCSADMAKAPEVDAHRDIGDKHQAIQDSLTALYTPPYQQKASKSVASEPKAKKTSASKTVPQENIAVASSPEGVKIKVGFNKEAQNVLISILALSLGSLLFVLGILQIFFSEDGWLRLEWDASLWFIYCLAALPLIYYGYRKTQTPE